MFKKVDWLLITLAAYCAFILLSDRSGKGLERHPSSDSSPVSHISATKIANTKLMFWLERKSSSLQAWMQRRGEADGPPDFLDFYFPPPVKLRSPDEAEALVARNTKELYDEYFPPNDPASYVGTFFESGHPYIKTRKGPYQWDSLKVSGMQDPKLFQAAVKKLAREAGIKSMRIGPNLHEVKLNDPASWETFIDKIEIMWLEGVTPTICVAFFPSLKAWEIKKADGSIDYEQSYLLNDQWPKDMGTLTRGLMSSLWVRAEKVEKQLGRKVNVVVNPINEPETLAGFNRHFWHGAHANWNHPEMFRFYIPSIINIAMANVEIRLAVEETAGKRRILFMHNEAMTPLYYPSHQGGGRFAVSKLMLGDEILLNEHLEDIQLSGLKYLGNNEIKWAIENYAFSSGNKNQSQQEKARLKITSKLQQLKDLHQDLHTRFFKTMKTDNILLLDYYYQTEFIPSENIEELAQRLAANGGEELKQIIGVKDDEAFLRILQKAATYNNSDLPPEGPKGPKLDFDYATREEINFHKFLTQHDFVVLERLIGLRREYHFSNSEPFKKRQQRAGLDQLKVPLYRTDHILAELLKDNAKKLRQVLAALPEEDLNPIISSLNQDGSKTLHELLGMERKFLLGFEPQHYARQIRAGIRYGLHHFMLEYVAALGIYAAGVGESGTPFYIFAPLLHDQMMMEYATALKAGIYSTQYAFGPAVDTRGWGKAPLGLHYDDDHEVNPSGLLKIVPAEGPHSEAELKFRGNEEQNQQWPQQFLMPLFEELRAAP